MATAAGNAEAPGTGIGAGMGIGIEVEIGIEELLRETVEALSRLDAGRVEALAEAAERLAAEAGPGRAGWPETAAEWRRAAARHWVLGHLVGATARQLAVQRRVLDRARNAGDGFRGYRPEGDAGLAARLNAALAWPGGRGAAG